MNNISKMITISTAHITDYTRSKLSKELNLYTGIAVYPKDAYGWFIYVTDDIINDTEIPSDLRSVCLYAKDMNCEVLCLDSDGKIVPYLNTYK